MSTSFLVLRSCAMWAVRTSPIPRGLMKCEQYCLLNIYAMLTVS